MANDNIITINDLTELPTAGTNDYLIISSGNNTYKIKASAVGGGGGGGAEDFIAEVSTNDFSTFTSTVTLSDLQTAYSAGKNLKLKATTPMGDLWGCLAWHTSTAVKFMIVIDDAGLITCDSNGWSLE